MHVNIDQEGVGIFVFFQDQLITWLSLEALLAAQCTEPRGRSSQNRYCHLRVPDTKIELYHLSGMRN